MGHQLILVQFVLVAIATIIKIRIAITAIITLIDPVHQLITALHLMADRLEAMKTPEATATIAGITLAMIPTALMEDLTIATPAAHTQAQVLLQEAVEAAIATVVAVAVQAHPEGRLDSDR